MRYGSIDVSHVPPPNPDNFWSFAVGRPRVIGVRPLLTFRVDALFADHVDGTQVLGSQVVAGELWLDMPVVITRSRDGSPQVTLVLREVDETACLARVQVLAVQGMRQMSQQ